MLQHCFHRPARPVILTSLTICTPVLDNMYFRAPQYVLLSLTICTFVKLTVTTACSVLIIRFYNLPHITCGILYYIFSFFPKQPPRLPPSPFTSRWFGEGTGLYYSETGCATSPLDRVMPFSGYTRAELKFKPQPLSELYGTADQK